MARFGTNLSSLSPYPMDSAEYYTNFERWRVWEDYKGRGSRTVAHVRGWRGEWFEVRIIPRISCIAGSLRCYGKLTFHRLGVMGNRHRQKTYRYAITQTWGSGRFKSNVLEFKDTPAIFLWPLTSIFFPSFYVLRGLDCSSLLELTRQTFGGSSFMSELGKGILLDLRNELDVIYLFYRLTYIDYEN